MSCVLCKQPGVCFSRESSSILCQKHSVDQENCVPLHSSLSEGELITVEIFVSSIEEHINNTRSKSFLNILKRAFKNDFKVLRQLTKLFKSLISQGIPENSDDNVVIALKNIRHTHGEVVPCSLLDLINQSREEINQKTREKILNKRIMAEIQRISREDIPIEESILNKEIYNGVNINEKDIEINKILRKCPKNSQFIVSNLVRILRSLDNLPFVNIDLIDANIEGRSMISSVFYNSDLRRSSLKYTNLTNSKLVNTNLLNTSFGVKRVIKNAHSISSAGYLDRNKIVIGDAEGYLNLWDLNKRILIHKAKIHNDSVISISISKDKNLIASAGSDQICCVSFPDLSKYKEYKLNSYGVFSVKFSHDSQFLGMSYMDKDLFVKNISDDSFSQQCKILGPGGFDFHPAENQVAAGIGNSICVWNITKEKTLHSIEIPEKSVIVLKFSQDGKNIIYTSWDHTFSVLDLKKNKLLYKYEHEELNEKCIDFYEDLIAICFKDKSIHIWDCKSQEIVDVFRGQIGKLSAMAFSEDCRQLVSTSSDSSIFVWEISENKTVSLNIASELTALAVSDSTIASGMSDGQICLWSPDGNLLKSFEGHREEIQALKITEGFILSCGRDSLLKKWSLDGEALQSLEIDLLNSHTVVFSQNSLLVAYCNRKQVNVAGTETGEIVLEINNFNQFCISISKDNSLLGAGVMSGDINIWRIPSGEKLLAFDIRAGGSLWAIDFSYDGLYLLSGSQSQIIRIWNLQTSKLVEEFIAHEKGLCDVCFSADGLVASSSYDGSVKVWEGYKLLQSVKFNNGIFKKMGFLEDAIVTGNNFGVLSFWNLDFD